MHLLPVTRSSCMFKYYIWMDTESRQCTSYQLRDHPVCLSTTYGWTQRADNAPLTSYEIILYVKQKKRKKQKFLSLLVESIQINKRINYCGTACMSSWINFWSMMCTAPTRMTLFYRNSIIKRVISIQVIEGNAVRCKKKSQKFDNGVRVSPIKITKSNTVCQ